LLRIAILAKGSQGIFEEILNKRVEAARRALLLLRKRYEKYLKEGLMPITKTYLGHLRNHFNTMGVIELPEAVANLTLNKDLWINCESREIKDALKLEKRIVLYVNSMLKEFEYIDGVPYNAEEVPAESAAYKLALRDFIEFRKLIYEKSLFIPMANGKSFYSNSIVPHYAKVSLPERARLEGEVQGPRCSWSSVGFFDKCPKCGGKADVWSRIVGYYRPIRVWNEGRVAEFMSRVHYGKRGDLKVSELGGFKITND